MFINVKQSELNYSCTLVVTEDSFGGGKYKQKCWVILKDSYSKMTYFPFMCELSMESAVYFCFTGEFKSDLLLSG